MRAILEAVDAVPENARGKAFREVLTVEELAGIVYGDDPTESQLRATRRAVRALADRGELFAEVGAIDSTPWSKEFARWVPDTPFHRQLIEEWEKAVDAGADDDADELFRILRNDFESGPADAIPDGVIVRRRWTESGSVPTTGLLVWSLESERRRGRMFEESALR